MTNGIGGQVRSRVKGYEAAIAAAGKARREAIARSGNRHHTVLVMIGKSLEREAREKLEEQGGSENPLALLRYSQAVAEIPEKRQAAIAGSLEQHARAMVEACREEADAVVRAARDLVSALGNLGHLDRE